MERIKGGDDACLPVLPELRPCCSLCLDCPPPSPFLTLRLSSNATAPINWALRAKGKRLYGLIHRLSLVHRRCSINLWTERHTQSSLTPLPLKGGNLLVISWLHISYHFRITHVPVFSSKLGTVNLGSMDKLQGNPDTLKCI